MFRCSRRFGKVVSGGAAAPFPSMSGLTITKFDGSHTYNQQKNIWVLLQEAMPLLAMPATYVALSLVKCVLHSALPLFVNSWYVTAAMCAGAGRIVAKGKSNHIVKDLRGKNVVITGASRGIGLHAAIQLSQMGANIHLVAREGAHVEAAMKAIRTAAKDGGTQTFTFSAVDFADLVAVQAFTSALQSEGRVIDILIHNAATLKFENRKASIGEDEMLVVNLLSPYVITEGLLPLIQKSSAGRIVNVGSSAHAGVTPELLQKYLNEGHHAPDHKHNALEHYGFTKLGLIYHTQQLGARSYNDADANNKASTDKVMDDDNGSGAPIQTLAAQQSPPTFVACCANPGGVVTDIYRDIKYATAIMHYFYYPFLLLMRTPYEGSQTIVNCCVRDDIVNGGVYMDCQHMPDSLSPVACNVKERATMMEWVERKLSAHIKTKGSSTSTTDETQQQQNA